MNETNVRNEILDSIDRMNTVTLESSLDVLFSLGAAYEKSAMIMEYASTPDELSMFSIFQEADTPTQDNATAEAKPAENNAAENTSTTVSSDDKAPAANAEAKKKSGILWFIPNLLKKLWQVIKDAWNGAVVPTAETVSDQTKDLFSKIAGKDESWVKEHAAELGLAGGALAAVLGLIAVVKRNEIAELLASLAKTLSAWFRGLKAAPKIAWENGSFITNIKINGLLSTVKSYKDAVGKYMQADKNYETIKSLIADLDKIPADPSIVIADSPVPFTYEAMINALNKAKEILGKDEPEPNVKIPENADDNTIKAANTANAKVSILSKISLAVSKALGGLRDWVTGIFKKEKEVDEQVNAAENTAPTEGEAKEGTENVEQNPASTENTNQAASEGGTENNTPDYTDEEEAFMKNTFAGQEQSVEEVPEGEETIQESATEEELTDAEIEVNNHWYN